MTCVGLAGLTWLSVSNSRGQQLLVDQASGTLDEIIVNATRIPEADVAQSFTPSLNAVGFVQFRNLITFPQGSSVTLTVNLREAAYNGPVISSTDPVTFVGFPGVGTFYFPGNVSVTPNRLYFFQPVVQSSGSLDIGFKDTSTYAGGDPWFNGMRSDVGDFWFREGIVVPEPSPVALLGLGAGMAFMWRKHPL